MLLGYRFVAYLTQPDRETRKRTRQPVFGRFMFDYPVTISGFCPEVGESQEVECLCPLSSFYLIHWLLEEDKSGFLRMQS